jgi:hypothetical protein
MRGGSITVRIMMHAPPPRPSSRTILPWLTAVLAGVAARVLAILILADRRASVSIDHLAGPVLAIGLMSVGMITGAAAGRMWVGLVLGVSAGAGLVLFAQALGLLPLMQAPLAGLAVIVASLSFAARGALFARSAEARGWWIALAIVAGEGAILFTAAASPEGLPSWLLALLPAQWASTAIGSAMKGAGTGLALWEVLALAGTAAGTLLVASLWPRRWPYLIMFGTWLALSALVWQQPVAPLPGGVQARTAAPSD